MAIINGVGPVGIRVTSGLWNGLLSYFSGDDTTADRKGLFNATLVNGTTYGTGKINNGFSLDGVNDYITLPNNSFKPTYNTKLGSYSISMWVKLNILPTGVNKFDFFSFGSSWSQSTVGELTNTGKILFTIGGQQILSVNSLTTSTWYHLVFTYNVTSSVASTFNLYINGVLDSSKGSGLISLPASSPCIIGRNYAAQYYFNGIIDEIGLWDTRALTQTEITELYNSGAGKQYTTGTDADAQAFITAASITDSTQMSAVNTLVTSLKSAGIWSKMKAIYPFVGGNATAHSKNLINPSQYPITWYGGFTHDSNGVTSNGINGYGYSPFIPSSGGLTSTNNHIAIYSRTTAAKDYYNAASDTYPAQNAINIWVRRTDNTAGYDSGNWPDDRNTFINTDGKGYYLGKVNNDATSKFYKNGTLMSTKSVTARSLSNVGFYIFTADFFKTSVITNQETAMFHVGLGLSDTEVTTLNTIIQSFQTTLGRQV